MAIDLEAEEIQIQLSRSCHLNSFRILGPLGARKKPSGAGAGLKSAPTLGASGHFSNSILVKEEKKCQVGAITPRRDELPLRRF
jgi:hypothetical protein